MMTTDVVKMTANEKKQILVGYLASGNSLWGLIDMFYKEADYDEEVGDIVEDLELGPCSQDQVRQQIQYYKEVGERVQKRSMSLLEG